MQFSRAAGPPVQTMYGPRDQGQDSPPATLITFLHPILLLVAVTTTMQLPGIAARMLRMSSPGYLRLQPPMGASLS
jgi:hypothetical protein